MGEIDEQPDDKHEETEPSGEKKPYLKPAYRSEEVFERLALTCGKVSPVQFQCRFNRKNS